MKSLKKLFDVSIDHRKSYAALITGGTALTVLIKAIIDQSSSDAYLLWSLGLFISICTLRDHSFPKHRIDAALPWILLATGLFLSVCFPALDPEWIAWIGIGSVLAWSSGAAAAGRLAVPLLIFAVLVPSTDYLYTLLSFPMSRISTVLTVFALNHSGIPCTHDQAVILLGNNHIAVTAACSGIDLLAVLLLLGWIVVYFEQKNALFRLLHYLTILPIIILCNSLRLIIILALFRVIGDRAFSNTIHSIAGYTMIIAATLLLFSVGRLFTPPEKA